jgi:ribA/ribD-fused uncharacterized protein
MAFSIWKQRRGHSSLSESYAKGIANKTKLIHKSDEQSASYPGSFQQSDVVIFLSGTKKQLVNETKLHGTGLHTKVHGHNGTQNLVVKVFQRKIVEKVSLNDLDCEMRKLVKLPRHPNVVKIHGYPKLVPANCKIRDSIVMDYCRLSLDQVIKQLGGDMPCSSWITTKKKIEILVGVSEGLSFLHKHGITHGNLKPTNVLFVDNVPDLKANWSHSVKVSDYGIEKFLIFKKNSASAESHLPLSDVVGNGKQKEYPLEWKPDADVFPFGLLVFTVALGHEPRVLDAIDAEHGFTIIERDDLDLQRWKKSFESIPTSESEVFASLIEGCLIKDSQERLHFRKVKDIVNGLHKLTANASMDNSARIHQAGDGQNQAPFVVAIPDSCQSQRSITREDIHAWSDGRVQIPDQFKSCVKEILLKGVLDGAQVLKEQDHYQLVLEVKDKDICALKKENKELHSRLAELEHYKHDCIAEQFKRREVEHKMEMKLAQVLHAFELSQQELRATKDQLQRCQKDLLSKQEELLEAYKRISTLEESKRILASEKSQQLEDLQYKLAVTKEDVAIAKEDHDCLAKLRQEYNNKLRRLLVQHEEAKDAVISLLSSRLESMQKELFSCVEEGISLEDAHESVKEQVQTATSHTQKYEHEMRKLERELEMWRMQDIYMDQQPKHKELKLLAADVCDSWERIGYYLGLQQSTLHLVEVNHEQLVERCLAMFEKWLSGRGKNPKTWSTLLEALRLSNLRPIADEIQGKMRTKLMVAIAPSLDTLMLDEPYEASQRKQAMFNPPEDQELGVKKKLPSVKSQEFNGRNVSLPIKTVNRSPQSEIRNEASSLPILATTPHSTKVLKDLQVSLQSLPSLFGTQECPDSPIYFHKRGEKYYEFSTMYQATMVIDGKEWPSVKNYYYAKKYAATYVQANFENFKTPQEAVSLAESPVGKELKCLGWTDEVKLDVMRVGLRHKFEQHSDLANLLLSTGNRQLMNNSASSFWGYDGGEGQNWLGKLLMEVRSKLQSGQDSLSP